MRLVDSPLIRCLQFLARPKMTSADSSGNPTCRWFPMPGGQVRFNIVSHNGMHQGIVEYFKKKQKKLFENTTSTASTHLHLRRPVAEQGGTDVHEKLFKFTACSSQSLQKSVVRRELESKSEQKQTVICHKRTTHNVAFSEKRIPQPN